jgi:hypothetical protein
MIADLYCVHQRGARIAAFLVPLGAINILCPLLTGVVSQNLGIPWAYKLMAIFAGVATVVVIFVIPETTYNRSSLYNIDTTSVEHLGELAEKEHHIMHDENPQQQEIAAAAATQPSKKSYLQLLAPFSGTYHSGSPFPIIFTPIKQIFNPAVLWSCVTQGAVSAWTVAVSFMLAQIFAVAPYNFTPAQVGYLYTGAIVGGLVAETICMTTNDSMAKFLARRNSGTYEPEFRLWLIIPMMITGIIGFFGFGFTIVHGNGPTVASTMYGFITASLIFSHVASGSYITDAFRDRSVEIFIVVMIFKNLLFFVFSLVVNHWLARDGPEKVFNTIGALQVAIAFLSLPLYVLGKKNRALVQRWGL